MPTVHRENGFSVKIYTNDHTPAHVHVFNSSGEAKFTLSLHGKEVELIDVIGMSRKEITQAGNIVASNNGHLLSEWRRIHG